MLVSAADLTNQYTPGLQIQPELGDGTREQDWEVVAESRQQLTCHWVYGQEALRIIYMRRKSFTQHILPASGRNLEDPLLNLQFSNRISSIDYFFENHLTVL